MWSGLLSYRIRVVSCRWLVQIEQIPRLILMVIDMNLLKTAAECPLRLTSGTVGPTPVLFCRFLAQTGHIPRLILIVLDRNLLKTTAERLLGFISGTAWPTPVVFCRLSHR